ncbi:MAG: ATP-dependent endonuclease [Candidatus Saccharibacteria bacterium]|nr:ATP-dependent endonuclease [Candidatus Saccharibacteria bacterium]
MRINKLKIKNYRLLRDFELNLEDNLSLLVGKNNTGKTSLLSLFEKFLINAHFEFEDINVELQKRISKDFEREDIEEGYLEGIELKIYIEYDREDNLANLSKFMLNLDPEENLVVLQFNYKINSQDISNIKQEMEVTSNKDVIKYLKKYHRDHFKRYVRALEASNEDNYVAVEERECVRKLLRIQTISANRGIASSGSSRMAKNQRLSGLSSNYYKKIEDISKNPDIQELRNSLSQADEKFTTAYKGIFSDLVEKIRKFGGIQEGESAIQIISSLSGVDILENNTSVIYDHDGYKLPENYNGLGYMNLIAMIFEIAIKLKNFEESPPSDICLLFIEEPEVHTHPQMQRVFIKNIKELLNVENFFLQTIMSTHSSHIASESNFDDIKYLLRESKSVVRAKDLKQLKEAYENDQYEFLKKYLTLTRAELFFADKVILIEGDTERIILPTMIEKIDLESGGIDKAHLSSQNISIVEVGAHAHVFEKLVAFLNIKGLVITDLDAVNAEGACPVREGVRTSNASLKHFFSQDKLEYFLDLSLEKRICKPKMSSSEPEDSSSKLLIAYQSKESGGDYCPRSFEDAFIDINVDFIKANLKRFNSLKNKDYFNEANREAHELAECIKKKTDFAIDIIYCSNAEYGNWNIPHYIREGLLWLRGADE